MSESIGLYTCNLTSRSRIGTNPFTGETVHFPLDDGLTPQERTNLEAQLSQMRASTADEDGYRTINCPDGGEFTIGVARNNTPLVSCHIEIITLTDDVIASILDLARSGNMAIRSSIDSDVVALTKPPQSGLIAGRWPGAPVINAPGQLRSWLEGSVWKRPD
ncbi:MAG TPA: hypothetical protein VIM11_15865 [Tepidisphaeraceae bacterium]|jgi:hypothetical protein